jgi:LCP family protein required for cell wall assembly
MSGKHCRRRRSWPRTFLLLMVVLAAVAALYHGLIRKPTLTADAAELDAAAASSSRQTAADTSGASASQAPDRTVRKLDDFVILVSGLDDDNGGSDTNILVNFDAGSGAIHCVSVPRDSGMRVSGKLRKVNSAYNIGGEELLAQTISQTLGIPVDYTVGVDLRGFVKLVDTIGGVDFKVPVNMDYDDPVQDLHIHFQKGMQHLDGQEALEVVRFRHNNKGVGGGYGTEDLGRIGTQQAFLKAVAAQTLTVSNLDKVPQLAKLFGEYVDSSLKVSELAWLGKEAVAIGVDNITFDTLPGAWSDSSNLYLLDGDAALETVNTLLNPYTLPRTAQDLDIPS